MQAAAWVTQQGGIIDENITVEYTKDKGNHIVARSPPSQLLIQIPSSLLINVKSLKIDDLECSAHGYLANYLYTADNAWTRTIPPISLPFLWPQRDIERLPVKYQKRINEQKQQVKDTFDFFGVPDYERWAWAWSSVNSRCLYWDVGLERPDQITLAPFVDLLNHSTNPETCVRVERKLGKMCVYCPQSHGKELTLFYGPHEDGFLLVEYGFIPAENQWNHIDITEYVEQLSINMGALKALGYDGNYTLNEDGVCFRTMIALSSIDVTEKQLARLSQGLDEIPDIEERIQHLYTTLKKVYTPKPTDRSEIQDLYKGFQKLLSVHK